MSPPATDEDVQREDVTARLLDRGKHRHRIERLRVADDARHRGAREGLVVPANDGGTELSTHNVHRTVHREARTLHGRHLSQYLRRVGRRGVEAELGARGEPRLHAGKWQRVVMETVEHHVLRRERDAVESKAIGGLQRVQLATEGAGKQAAYATPALQVDVREVGGGGEHAGRCASRGAEVHLDLRVQRRLSCVDRER